MIEVFLTYTDNYPAGTFYLKRSEIEQLLKEAENTDLDSIHVGPAVYLKDEIKGIRINGNIGIEWPFHQKYSVESDFSLLDLMNLLVE